MKTKVLLTFALAILITSTAYSQTKIYPSDDGPGSALTNSGITAYEGTAINPAVQNAPGPSSSLITTDDNEDNFGTGNPDYDVDVYLFRSSQLAPIEFNIFVEATSISDAKLSLLAWDVDWATLSDPNQNERDAVYINEHFVGYLTGANNEWSTSIFNLDPAWINPGPDGKNTVKIDIDAYKTNNWAVTIDWGQLVIDGGTQSTAEYRSVTIPKTLYDPCESVAITEEIDADPDRYVRAETNILDPDGNIIAGTSRYLTATTGDEPFTENLQIPCSAVGGNYQVVTILYDASTNVQLDIEYVPFNVICDPVWSPPVDVTETVSCADEATEPIAPDVVDGCGRTVESVLISKNGNMKWAIICEREVIYIFRYTAYDGSTADWTFTYIIEYEDVQMPADGEETISSVDQLYIPTHPPIYDNCGHLLKTEGPTSRGIAECGGTVTYTWAFLDCNRKVVYWNYTFTIVCTNNNTPPVVDQGNTTVFGSVSTAPSRRAIPVTFSESGEINSLSIYHNGGTGNMLLAVYSDQAGYPSTLLGTTAPTAVNSSEGWQTVSLGTIPVTSGQKVWLSFVFENLTGVRYTTGAPGRALSYARWSAGMPATFGSSTIASTNYSIYCTYTPGEVAPPTFDLGNTGVYGSVSTAPTRRAIPVTFSEDGEINSISIYHNGGTGNMLLAVYSDQAGYPSSLLGTTAPTAVNSSEGWQTVSLGTIPVTSGQKVWLSFVFENLTGVRYATGAPGRALSYARWSEGMPPTFGASTIAGINYSIYCTYITDGTKSAEIATGTVPDDKSADLNVYPNPFSDGLRFEFVSQESVNARIDMYDMTGRMVKTIFEQPIQDGVSYKAEFRPEAVISGMYIYRVTIGDNITNGKVIFKKK